MRHRLRTRAARHAGWVVLDGYHFDAEYQRQLKTAGVKLLIVDDTAHAGAYAADRRWTRTSTLRKISMPAANPILNFC